MQLSRTSTQSEYGARDEVTATIPGQEWFSDVQLRSSRYTLENLAKTTVQLKKILDGSPVSAEEAHLALSVVLALAIDQPSHIIFSNNQEFWYKDTDGHVSGSKYGFLPCFGAAENVEVDVADYAMLMAWAFSAAVGHASKLVPSFLLSIGDHLGWEDFPDSPDLNGSSEVASVGLETLSIWFAYGVRGIPSFREVIDPRVDDSKSDFDVYEIGGVLLELYRALKSGSDEKQLLVQELLSGGGLLQAFRNPETRGDALPFFEALGFSVSNNGKSLRNEGHPFKTEEAKLDLEAGQVSDLVVTSLDYIRKQRFLEHGEMTEVSNMECSIIAAAKRMLDAHKSRWTDYVWASRLNMHPVVSSPQASVEKLRIVLACCQFGELGSKQIALELLSERVCAGEKQPGAGGELSYGGAEGPQEVVSTILSEIRIREGSVSPVVLAFAISPGAMRWVFEQSDSVKAIETVFNVIDAIDRARGKGIDWSEDSLSRLAFSNENTESVDIREVLHLPIDELSDCFAVMCSFAFFRLPSSDLRSEIANLVKDKDWREQVLDLLADKNARALLEYFPELFQVSSDAFAFGENVELLKPIVDCSLTSGIAHSEELYLSTRFIREIVLADGASARRVSGALSPLIETKVPLERIILNFPPFRRGYEVKEGSLVDEFVIYCEFLKQPYAFFPWPNEEELLEYGRQDRPHEAAFDSLFDEFKSTLRRDAGTIGDLEHKFWRWMSAMTLDDPATGLQDKQQISFLYAATNWPNTQFRSVFPSDIAYVHLQESSNALIPDVETKFPLARFEVSKDATKLAYDLQAAEEIENLKTAVEEGHSLRSLTASNPNAYELVEFERAKIEREYPDMPVRVLGEVSSCSDLASLLGFHCRLSELPEFRGYALCAIRRLVVFMTLVDNQSRDQFSNLRAYLSSWDEEERAENTVELIHDPILSRIVPMILPNGEEHLIEVVREAFSVEAITRGILSNMDRLRSAGGTPIMIGIRPSRGLVAQLSSYFCNTCWTGLQGSRQGSIMRNHPNMTFFLFSDLSDVKKPLPQGGTMVIETQTEDNKSAYVIRAFDPNGDLSRFVHPEELFGNFLSYLAKIATEEGIDRILLPRGKRSDLGQSTRPITSLYFSQAYPHESREFIDLMSEEDTTFNSIPIHKRCFVVWDKEKGFRGQLAADNDDS